MLQAHISRPVMVSRTMLNYPRFCSDLYGGIRNISRQCSPEFRDRALRLLGTTRNASDVSEFEAIKSVWSKLGLSEDSVRRWRRIAPDRCRLATQYDQSRACRDSQTRA